LTEPQAAHESSDELLGRVAHELSLLVRADLELAAAERAPQVRRISIEVATALAAAVALVLALAAASLAAIQGLATALPSWAASLIVAGAWALVGVLLLRHDHPRRLVQRLSAESTGRAIESARAARGEAERAVKDTAEKLAEAVAREAAERELKKGFEAAEHLAGEAEDEAEDLLKELVVALLTSGKAGISFLERIMGREPPE
jgi:putative superfamily III holin-X